MEPPRLFCTLTLLYLRYVRTQMSRGTKTLWSLLKSNFQLSGASYFFSIGHLFPEQLIFKVHEY